MIDQDTAVHDALLQKIQAETLLHELIETKRQVDGNTADGLPRRDLFKRVTGASSLENAISSTRRAIMAYDRLIAERDGLSGISSLSISATGVPSAL